MTLDFSKALIMGIVNLTPDSFFDGENHQDFQERLQHMITEGADIIDIGAESTFGPESQVSAEEEWKRLEPALKSINLDEVFVSLDTYKAEVAEKALEMGVQMINDVTALRGDERMIEVLMKHKPYICLMYSADESSYASRTDHQYDDVIETIKQFLKQQTDLLIEAGFPKEKIIIDPGMGFFISGDPKYSWEVIDRLEELKVLGFPILVGHSLKSFLGGEIGERLATTLDAARKCIQNGANILRVHHVAEHRKVVDEMLQ